MATSARRPPILSLGADATVSIPAMGTALIVPAEAAPIEAAALPFRVNVLIGRGVSAREAVQSIAQTKTPARGRG